MAPFGAFIELEEGVDGLVHISQISYTHVEKPEDVLNVGEVIKVKITDVNPENKRISLSKKEADKNFDDENEEYEYYEDAPEDVNDDEEETELEETTETADVTEGEEAEEQESGTE